MNFNQQELTRRLAGRKIGGTVLFFPELDSSNDTAFQMALNGAPDGTVVIADSQRSGKGRLKRRWLSPSGCNLYTSLVLRPSLKAAAASQITLVAGVALAEYLSLYCPGYVKLKWPNDILVREKKICGILTEMKAAGSTVEFIILGVGVNLNITKDAFDDTLGQAATSLREETDREISRLDFAVGMYAALERFYGLFLREGFPPVRDKWHRYAAGLGEAIRVKWGSEIREGEMAGLDEDGALLVREGNGMVTRIIAGDASLGGG